MYLSMQGLFLEIRYGRKLSGKKPALSQTGCFCRWKRLAGHHGQVFWALAVKESGQ